MIKILRENGDVATQDEGIGNWLRNFNKHDYEIDVSVVDVDKVQIEFSISSIDGVARDHFTIDASDATIPELYKLHDAGYKNLKKIRGGIEFLESINKLM